MLPIELLSVVIGLVCVVLIAIISMRGPPDDGDRHWRIRFSPKSRTEKGAKENRVHELMD
jgi:hypothetical protein